MWLPFLLMAEVRYWLQDSPGIIFLVEKAAPEFPRKLNKILHGNLNIGNASLRNASKTGLPLCISMHKKKECDYWFLKKDNDFIDRKRNYCADRAFNPIERVIRAAARIGADPVILLRADRPCIPPSLIKECVAQFLELNSKYSGCGYFSTTNRSDTDEYIGGLPDGMDIEILTMQNLIRCYKYGSNTDSRKYITNWAKNFYTPYFFDDNRHKFDYNLKYQISKPEDLYPLRETYEICGFNSDN